MAIFNSYVSHYQRVNNPAIFFGTTMTMETFKRPRAKGAWLHEVLNTLEGEFSHGFSGKMI